MLRFDDNADDDDRISYGDIPRESFLKHIKKGFIIGTLLTIGKV